MAAKNWKKVLIAGDRDGNRGPLLGAYKDMFRERGYILTNKISMADFVQFTGGTDVHPELYNHHTHEKTFANTDRDKADVLLYFAAAKEKKPMAGICRGGQFLNVMMGGTLFQDVSNHTQEHTAFDHVNKKSLLVSSTHHQMMCPPTDPTLYQILLETNISTFREKMTSLRGDKKKIPILGKQKDFEAIVFRKKKVLCFQPHPEFRNTSNKECQDLYFDYLERFILQKD